MDSMSLQESFFSHMENSGFSLDINNSEKYNMKFIMNKAHGDGLVEVYNIDNMFYIIMADYTPYKEVTLSYKISQPFLEISYFETDSIYYTERNLGRQRMNKGIHCYISTNKKGYIHYMPNKRVKYIKILISQEHVYDYLQSLYGNEYLILRKAFEHISCNPNFPQLKYIFNQIKSCCIKGQTKQIYFRAKILEMLALITHYLEQKKVEDTFVRLDRKDMNNIKTIAKLLESNLGKTPKLEDLSMQAGMSVSRFKRAFKKVYGITAFEYLRSVRMNAAIDLLKKSNDTICEVSKQVGYTNPGRFSAHFKNAFNLSPKDYRALSRLPVKTS